MTKQIETTLKVRYWGEDADHSPEVHDAWLDGELARVTSMIEAGNTEGDLTGPEGERGWWEVDTKRGDSDDLDAGIPALDLDQIQWRKEGLAPDDPASVLQAVIKVGPTRMYLQAIAVTKGNDGIWNAVDSSHENELVSIERANGDVASGTTTINGREYVLWALPFGR